MASGILVHELESTGRSWNLAQGMCTSTEGKKDVQLWLQWASGMVRLGVNVKNLALCPCPVDRELTLLVAFQVPAENSK